MAGAAIVARGVWKRLGGRPVLRGVDLEVPKGSVTVLAGPNGAGKTTLIRVILGLYRRDSGSVEVLGRDPQGDPSLYTRVGYLPEDAEPYERLTGYENLLFYARLYASRGGWSVEELVERAVEVSGLDREALSRRASTYSKGMRRRLLLAASVMHMPSLAVLDEPTSGLDVFSAHRVRGIVRGLAERGLTVLLTTHNLLEAGLVADRVAFMVDGRIVFQGRVEEALAKYNAGDLEEAFVKAAGGRVD